MSKDEELEQLREENAVLREQVAQLSERISELEARLAKDSHNSHLPPSSDRFHCQPKSLRKKSEQKLGGNIRDDSYRDVDRVRKKRSQEHDACRSAPRIRADYDLHDAGQ